MSAEADYWRTLEKILIVFPIVGRDFSKTAGQPQKFHKRESQFPAHSVRGGQEDTMPFIHVEELAIRISSEEKYEQFIARGLRVGLQPPD